MTVKLNPVNMVGHVSMETTHSLAFAWLDLWESIVKQVRSTVIQGHTGHTITQSE